MKLRSFLFFLLMGSSAQAMKFQSTFPDGCRFDLYPKTLAEFKPNIIKQFDDMTDLPAGQVMDRWGWNLEVFRFLPNRPPDDPVVLESTRKEFQFLLDQMAGNRNLAAKYKIKHPQNGRELTRLATAAQLRELIENLNPEKGIYFSDPNQIALVDVVAENRAFTEEQTLREQFLSFLMGESLEFESVKKAKDFLDKKLDPALIFLEEDFARLVRLRFELNHLPTSEVKIESLPESVSRRMTARDVIYYQKAIEVGNLPGWVIHSIRPIRPRTLGSEKNWVSPGDVVLHIIKLLDHPHVGSGVEIAHFFPLDLIDVALAKQTLEMSLLFVRDAEQALLKLKEEIENLK